MVGLTLVPSLNWANNTINAKHLLWWLILCATLTGLRDAQRAGRTPSLEASVSMLLGEMSIWVRERSEEDGPPRCEWACSRRLRSRAQQKGRGRGDTHWAGAKTSVFSCLQTLVLLVLRSGRTPTATLLPHCPFSDLQTQTELQSGNYTTGFPGPQGCRGQVASLLSLSRPHKPILIRNLLSTSFYSSVGSAPLGRPDQQTSFPVSLGFGYVPGRGCLCDQPPGKSLGAESPVSFPE